MDFTSQPPAANSRSSLPPTYPSLVPGHIVVRPKPIDDLLVNPHIGITTFQRFNNQPLYENGKWSEEGPTEAVPNLSAMPENFPVTSISYCRWFWDALEPEQGKVKWEIIDSALDEARKHHQTLAIRLMPYDGKVPMPKWYQASGARRAASVPGERDQDTVAWNPDFSDPLYLKYWGGLIAEAGRRYDGNPDLDTVDISSIGFWGEGWSPYMPSFDVVKQLTDIYIKAFPRTPLLQNFDEPGALAYGCSQGAGWRLDCWGDMRTTSIDKFFPNEMLDVYPQQIVRCGIEDVWKRSPISLEVCGTPVSWIKNPDYEIDYVLDQALRWHTTSINLKSAPIPPVWKEKFDEFQKKLGYRYQLRRFEFAPTARAGSMMPINMWWLNAGVAPIYQQYTLALKLESPNDSAVIDLPTDIRKWMPGDAVVDTTVYLPATVKPGEYIIKVGLLNPRTREPAIRLAIEGRDDGGWYPMGLMDVS